MFVVSVTFDVVAGRLDAFLPLILANAKASLQIEAGCHQFDVCQHPDNPTEIYLYELYTDASAFDAHCASDHFRAFVSATDGMVAGKTVSTYSRLN